MRRCYTGFAIAFTAVLLASAGVCAEDHAAMDALSSDAGSESIYAYDQNDIPEIFFFPREKARWDGSKVTMREWYMLTDLQKERFITEYIGQLQGGDKPDTYIAGVDYLKALNIFSAYSNDRTVREPSTKFIDILLSGQGKASDKEEPDGSGR